MNLFEEYIFDILLDVLETSQHKLVIFWRLDVRLQYLQCVSNGNTAVLH